MLLVRGSNPAIALLIHEPSQIPAAHLHTIWGTFCTILSFFVFLRNTPFLTGPYSFAVLGMDTVGNCIVKLSLLYLGSPLSGKPIGLQWDIKMLNFIHMWEKGEQRESPTHQINVHFDILCTVFDFLEGGNKICTDVFHWVQINIKRTRRASHTYRILAKEHMTVSVFICKLLEDMWYVNIYWLHI